MASNGSITSRCAFRPDTGATLEMVLNHSGVHSEALLLGAMMPRISECLPAGVPAAERAATRGGGQARSATACERGGAAETRPGTQVSTSDLRCFGRIPAPEQCQGFGEQPAKHDGELSGHPAQGQRRDAKRHRSEFTMPSSSRKALR